MLLAISASGKSRDQLSFYIYIPSNQKSTNRDVPSSERDLDVLLATCMNVAVARFESTFKLHLISATTCSLKARFIVETIAIF